MNLVRLGHYHTPTGTDDAGFCQTALVVASGDFNDANLAPGFVNLAVWNHDAGQEVRRNVYVSEPQPEGASFHLSGDCPWKR